MRRSAPQVEACIRPERIVLHTQAVTDRGNVLQAQVRGVIYFGDHLRLLCAVGDGQAAATVKLPLSVPRRAAGRRRRLARVPARA